MAKYVDAQLWGIGEAIELIDTSFISATREDVTIKIDGNTLTIPTGRFFPAPPTVSIINAKSNTFAPTGANIVCKLHLSANAEAYVMSDWGEVALDSGYYRIYRAGSYYDDVTSAAKITFVKHND